MVLNELNLFLVVVYLSKLKFCDAALALDAPPEKPPSCPPALKFCDAALALDAPPENPPNPPALKFCEAALAFDAPPENPPKPPPTIKV